MTQLLLIRHAATDLAGTFCGHTDPPLNARGRAQLTPLLSALVNDQIDAIYASDLIRARETAAAIAAARNLPVTLRPALREIHFGDWESLTWPQIETRDRSFAGRWIAEFPALSPPNGEPFSNFRTRVLAELTHLRRQAETQNLAIVIHAGVLRLILQDLALCSPDQAFHLTRDYTCIIRCTQHDSGSPLQLQPA